MGDIIRNLQDIHYPKDLYDIYVIADNCSDRTAEISRELGAIAMERNHKLQIGKGYGIEWFLDQLWKLEGEGKVYDAVAIFDADNLVSHNFLQQVNTKMDQGHEVIQAYLDSKKPNDTWITKSYAFSYWAASRIYQTARENIGLSAQLGGTGMIFSRWMKGHFYCAFRYAKPLIHKIVKAKGSRWIALDVLIYLFQPTLFVLALSGLALLGLSVFEPLPLWVPKYVHNTFG